MPYQREDGVYIVMEDAKLHEQRIPVGDFGSFYNPVSNILSIPYEDDGQETVYRSFPLTEDSVLDKEYLTGKEWIIVHTQEEWEEKVDYEFEEEDNQ